MTTDTQHRKILDLSRDWRFVRRHSWRWQLCAAPANDGPLMNLPHSWNAQDDFQEGVTYYRGPGTYWKNFPLSVDDQGVGRRWYLEADGFYGTGDVWLNGQCIGQVDGQYLGFKLDVTSLLSFNDENTLCIRLTNRCKSHVLPGIKYPDFLLYGGLAGPMRLVGISALHFLAYPQVVCEDVLSPTPTVSIRCGVANHSALPRHCLVRWAVGRINAACDLQLAPGEVREDLALRLVVPGARLWSPVHPHLYQARGELLEDGGVKDAPDIRFGFRQAEFRPDQGFFLNGERLELRGVNRHENMPGFGQALPPALHREDAQIIRSLGLNFVRLSHYPQSPVFLDACDELGLLVYAELASWKSVRTGRWLKNADRQFRAMIQRDRNRPGIILWGMGNESRSRKAFLQLRAAARELDPTRPVTYAENHLYRAMREKTIGLPDVWACNYEFAALEQGRDAARLRCAVVSECSNYPPAARGNLSEELRQVEIIEQDLAQFRNKPYVAGFALWCLTDYGTLRRNRFLRYSGILDAWRMPKPAAALMQARYIAAPMLRVFGDWQPGSDTQRSLHIFTNCSEVRIFCNKIPWQVLPAQPHMVVQVPFQAGELCVEGWHDQKSVVTDRLFTSESAMRLIIQSVTAFDAEWLTFLVCAVDDAGRTDVMRNGDVTLAVTGAAHLHTYKPGGIIALRGGIGRGFLSRKDANPVTLRARMPGLANAELRL